MYEEAVRASEKYVDIFGKDNFFLELQDHGLPDQKLVNQGLMRMSRDTGLKLVATNDIHYYLAEDEKAHDILHVASRPARRWRMRTGCATRGTVLL